MGKEISNSKDKIYIKTMNFLPLIIKLFYSFSFLLVDSVTCDVTTPYSL